MGKKYRLDLKESERVRVRKAEGGHSVAREMGRKVRKREKKEEKKEGEAIAEGEEKRKKKA